MCGKRDSDDPDDYGPASFGPARNYRRRGQSVPPEDHRGLFIVPVLAMTALAMCGKRPPWPRDEHGRPEDPARVSARRRGLIKFLRDLITIPRPRRA